MATIYLRTIIMYLVLIIAIRMMGKRQVGELEISELVITFMLSELAVIPVSDKNIPIVYSLIPIFSLLSVEVILSFSISKSSGFKKILFGKPFVIIKHGVIDQKGLSKLRMSPSELMSELRLKGISSPDEVEYAIIEDNGQISVFKKSEMSPVTPKDIGTSVTEKGISHSIVVRGKIYNENLAQSGRDANWIKAELNKRNISIKNIYLMTVDDCGKINIIMKERG